MSGADPVRTFLDECEELLLTVEDLLLNVEQNAGDPEAINTLFRAVHTIKGSSGVFGFNDVVEFTHCVETVMDRVRAGERKLDAELAGVLLECKDHIAALIDCVAGNDEAQSLPDALRERGLALIVELQGAPPASTAASVSRDGSEPAASGHGAQSWLISLRFAEGAFRNGIDPLSFLRYLRTVGEVVDTLTLVHHIAEQPTFDPESCYLWLEIWLRSEADKQTIEDVFAFAEDDCDIHILPPSARADEYLEKIEGFPTDHLMRIGDMLVGSGAVTQRELDEALRAQAAARDSAEGGKSAQPLGEVLVQQGVVQRPVVEGALAKQRKIKDNVIRESSAIRVDAEKLGQLINLVGELVTASATTEVLARTQAGGRLQEAIANMSKLVGDIRDSALLLRMVQIGETFNRFRRVVRDLSKELGKSIDLQIEGGEAELDKTVVERLGDPLMHLVRNAIDHGIESADVRAQRGKPATGTIKLSARHDSGSIVICIADDGAGLDTQRIRAKAVAKGLIQPEQQLGEHELLQLIFAPGLSTKEQATDLSGRGVGMDVVKRNVEAARGSVEVASDPGVGTEISIRLPLTLAIIDGFLVGVGEDSFVLPLGSVVECVEMTQADWERKTDRHFINLRGRALPFIRLRELFGMKRSGAEGSPDTRENLVVVRHGSAYAGIVVDRLEGELQAVIKPLGEVFGNLRIASGATVMGNGEVALILDIEQLVRAASNARECAA